MPTDVLADEVKRMRLLDLSFSLYESLNDLLQDLARMIEEPDEWDTDDIRDRVSIGAMNCHADMILLAQTINGNDTGIAIVIRLIETLP